ncbi:MAG: ABC transporter permease [Chitinophagaceae bacterium]
MSANNDHTFVIKPKRSLWDVNLRELWQYRDLLMLLVKRDFISVYKQTILGPVWFFIQPLLTTFTFTIIFGMVAKISTGGIPEMLFYLTGITFWNYFSSCLTSTSNTFVSNASVFGKVYFPRLIVPLSVVISNLMKLAIQFVLLVGVWAYYLLFSDTIHPQITLVFMPVILLLFALMGLGFGLIFSAMTTKYRDLSFLIAFGVQLLMYGSAVIYPVSVVAADKQWILFLNPLIPLMEAIKFSFLGEGILNWAYIAYSSVFTIIVLIIGVLVFNKVEKGFIDTV